jgi:long-chain acyl-CoA synthetase
MNIVADFLKRSALRFPDKVALVDGDREFTYSELQGASNRVVAGLRSSGLRPGDRVAYHGNNRWELVVTLFALIQGGFVLCPLNVMLRPAELEYIIGLGGIRLILTTSEGEANVRALQDRFDFTLSSYDDPQGLFHRWMAQPAPEHVEHRNPDDAVALFFTSGTTGDPKGAPIDQEFVSHLAHSWIIACRYTPDDVYLVMTPMFWAVASIHGLLPVMLAGGKVVLMRRFDPEGCSAMVRRHGVTTFFAVPTVLTMLLDRDPQSLQGTLRVCTVGGSPLTAETVQRFESLTGARLLNTYGLTEAGVIAREMLDAPRRAGCAGTPGGTVQMKIVDEQGNPVSPGTPGEVLARGFTAIKGYWRDGRVDHATLPDGWVHTGDVAVLEDGFVRILDRTKDMIITGGANIYSAEVERVIALHPQVRTNALIGIPDRVKGELAVAYVVLREPGGATAPELDAFCRERLSAYKIPRRFVFVDALPMTPTGKVQKAELRRTACSPAEERPAH